MAAAAPEALAATAATGGVAAAAKPSRGAAAATPEEQAAGPVAFVPVLSGCGPVNGIPCSMRHIKEAGMRYSR